MGRERLVIMVTGDISTNDPEKQASDHSDWEALEYKIRDLIRRPEYLHLHPDVD